MTCAIERVIAVGLSLGVPWADTELTTGSLVLRVPGPCLGTTVGIVATNPVYARGLPAASGIGCVDPAALAPASKFIALADNGPYKAGDLVEGLPDDCADHLADFATLRPIRDEELAAVDQVRTAYEPHFGPIRRDEVPWTDWGYVGLPMTLWSDQRRLRELETERLDTPERRVKGAIAEGPRGAWYHFPGTDAPDTDRWATPNTISAFVDLAARWFQSCTADHDAARCAIGVADLAWFAPLRPDPLGHKDHWKGECLDIRPFRTDGSHYETWWNRPDDRTGVAAYDRALTRKFIQFARSHARSVDTIYFDDPRVLERPRGMPRRQHSDHIHLCFDGK